MVPLRIGRGALLAWSVVSGLTGSPCAAADQPSVGPRAIAMGNAFTAVADDATAIFWNPAGLPWIGNQEISGTHADLFGSGVKDDYIAFVLPVSSAHAVAADWYHSGLNDDELDFGENRFDLAYGGKLWSSVSIGLNAKYLTRNTGLDDVVVREGNGFGVDAGVLLAPLDWLRLGASLQNITDTKMEYSGGVGTSVLYERSLRVGSAFRIIPRGTLALDIDDRVHLGAEYSPLAPVALRAGLEQDLEDTGEDPSYAMGVGLKAGIFRFDYALSVHPTLGETSHFGVSLGFNFNPAKVRIEKVEANDVFSSLQKSYAQEAFGTVRVRNLDDRPLTVKLSVFSPELMEQSTDQEIVLRPKVSQDIPLTAVLSDKIVSRVGDRRVQLTVGVTYTSQRLPRTEKRSTNLIAYGPGAIQWGAGVGQAAAYVTLRDPVVMDFAREACRTVAQGGEIPLGNRNIGFTMAIVDALSSLGMVYLPDPNSPFQASSQTAGAVDTIHYPRETLAQRAGDCDDTSVLVSALLESVGIPTRLVDVPGHLFLLAGTGIHERNRLAMGIDEERYVVRDEQVWIPIETTVLGKGFAQAWQEGAQAYLGWAERDRVTLVSVTEAQSRYEPAVLPDPARTEIPPVDQARLETLIMTDSAALADWRSRYLATRYADVQAGLEASPKALNEVAHVYCAAGDVGEARQILERALAQEPGSARTYNNLANTHAMDGNFSSAIEEYRKALDIDSTDGGVWLNLGLARYVAGDTAQAVIDLAEALGQSGGYDRACRLLGLMPEAGSAREGKSPMSATEARDLLRRALSRVPNPPATADSSSVGTRVPEKKSPRLRVAAARSGSQEDSAFGALLYWKE